MVITNILTRLRRGFAKPKAIKQDRWIFEAKPLEQPNGNMELDKLRLAAFQGLLANPNFPTIAIQVLLPTNTPPKPGEIEAAVADAAERFANEYYGKIAVIEASKHTYPGVY